jgi:hypothetical protein
MHGEFQRVCAHPAAVRAMSRAHPTAAPSQIDWRNWTRNRPRDSASRVAKVEFQHARIQLRAQGARVDRTGLTPRGKEVPGSEPPISTRRAFPTERPRPATRRAPPTRSDARPFGANAQVRRSPFPRAARGEGAEGVRLWGRTRPTRARLER